MKPLIYYVTLFLALFSVACQKQDKTYRILTCGIRHESNTFSTVPTLQSDFTVKRGAEVLVDQDWAKYLQEQRVEIIPTLHAYSWPGGVVEKRAFEAFKNEILDGIRKAGTFDAIYLDMHGALHVEGYDDPQATFIREIRELVGDDMLISGSFDTHGNLSEEFVKHLNLVTGYRTVPHRDGAETKVRAVRMLLDCLKEKRKPHIEVVPIPILVPGEKSITEVEPLYSIYQQIPVVSELPGLMDVSILAGYAWGDLPRTAMRVFVVAEDKKYASLAREKAVDLASQVWEARHGLDLDVPSGSINDMIDLARTAGYAGKTVFISDSGDNTTAGAPGDNPQVLKAFINKQVKNAIVTGIVDPEAMEQCIKAGIGKKIHLTIGGKKDQVFGSPLKVDATVEFISPDSILTTPRGAVVIDVNGIKTVLLNSRRSFTELRDFEQIGADPLSFDIVVVKLGYLYPQLRDIAPVHLMALTSGFCNLDMTTLPFRKVNRPIYPLDPEMEWKP